MRAKLLFVVGILLVTTLLGCAKVKSDLGDSAANLQADFNDVKNTVSSEIDDAKEFYGDLKEASKQVQEAKDAVEAIGN